MSHMHKLYCVIATSFATTLFCGCYPATAQVETPWPKSSASQPATAKEQLPAEKQTNGQVQQGAAQQSSLPGAQAQPGAIPQANLPGAQAQQQFASPQSSSVRPLQLGSTTSTWTSGQVPYGSHPWPPTQGSNAALIPTGIQQSFTGTFMGGKEMRYSTAGSPVMAWPTSQPGTAMNTPNTVSQPTIWNR
jgi:hypothetical protein